MFYSESEYKIHMFITKAEAMLPTPQLLVRI